MKRSLTLLGMSNVFLLLLWVMIRAPPSSSLLKSPDVLCARAQLLDVGSRLECSSTPPRVQYVYKLSKFRYKYIKNWQFYSPECKKNICRNEKWDKPFIEGRFRRLSDGGRGLKDVDIGDLYYAGDECNQEIQFDTWL